MGLKRSASTKAQDFITSAVSSGEEAEELEGNSVALFLILNTRLKHREGDTLTQ